MYGLPEDFDFAMFDGRTVDLVGFSANTVVLWFDSKLSITIEATYSHMKSPDASAIRVKVPSQESSLIQLSGKSVVRAEGENSGTLVLHFEDGQILKCFDDSPYYESYRITNQGVEICV